MWLTDNTASEGFTFWKMGLYPSPIAKTKDFYLLGLLVGRALLDSRILDLPLNEIFVDVIFGRTLVLSLRTLSQVDPELARTLKDLKSAKVAAFEGLYFVHPSFANIELCPGGAERAVTPSNYEEYLDSLLRYFLEVSLVEPANVFREAFNTIIPLSAFKIFTANEVLRLINGDAGGQVWEAKSIMRDIRADHGYTKDNTQIHWLAEVFSELSLNERGRLVQFLTGAPQLPSGGWGRLRPALTVVCRTSPDPDNNLPTVMTCANYLKLPRYSSKEILKSKLMLAIREGQGSFLLS
jgi:E3 ubiquitin-protein ligase TRIP12